jgi:5'-nucleotidase (lipoprotein e(P4) family)
MAVAWKATAAEYEALYIQGFNVARMHVDRARRDGRRNLAVISDLDDTVLDTRDYWREVLAASEQLFNDSLWDAWVAKNNVKATPGALEFLTFCRESGVEVFYVTSRDQGPKTMELVLGNLKAAALPFADEAHVKVLVETSDKEPTQRQLAQSRDVVVYLGDNLNDFSRSYYVTDFESRRKRLSLDRAEFGRRFILFPNPTDGHWIRAILGESEPPPTPENLAKLHRLIGRK